MTKIEATYRLRIHERGTTDPDNNTVDFTLDASVLGRDLPSIPGPVARPLDGRTETQAWSLAVVDRNDVLTSRLADGGRMHLLGRLAEYQESRDGGSTGETLYTGRIAGLTETSHGRYEVRLADERWIARAAAAFVESGAPAIYRFGLLCHWRGGAGSLKREDGPLANRPPGLAWKVWQVSESSRLVYLQRDHGGAYNFAPVLLREGLDLIRGDRKKNAPTADASGNYETVRMRFGDIE